MPVPDPACGPVLNVAVKSRTLSKEAEELRTAQLEDDRRNEAIAGPRIQKHLTTYGLVAQHPQDLHAHIADTTDLDPAGYSRPAAVWLMAGRCLGLLRALLVQVESGICGEAIGTARMLHEAMELVMVFSDRDEDEVLRLWLDDEGRHGYVKPSEAREAQGRFEAKLAEAMMRQGLGILERTTAKSADVYDLLSRAGHNRRSWVLDAVWLPARRMAYGPQWSAVRRAAYVEFAGTLTTSVASIVGDALRPWLPAATWEDNIVPLRESIEAVRIIAPLDAASIRHEAGTG